MAITFKPLSPILGSRVEGVDIARGVDDETLNQLLVELGGRGLLVFPNQTLTPRQHVDFSRRFGTLIEHVLVDALLEGFPEIYVVSNVKENGKAKGRAYPGTYWHSDLSYVAEPSLGSLLYAMEIPEIGGDTLFSNMYAAYEGLSEGLQRMLKGLTADHDFAYADERIFSKRDDKKGLSEADRHKVPPAPHPVVRKHPVSGRSALYVNEGFTRCFSGMTEDESRPLLDYLHRKAQDPVIGYRHQWTKGDVVFWDNRCTIHQAIKDYGYDQRRHMHRTTIRGERPIPA